MSLTFTSLTTSLSVEKVVQMIQAAKSELNSELTETLKAAETRMSNDFVKKMQNVTKEIITDILADRNILGQQMVEVRSCLSHQCKHGGTCHATADLCVCPKRSYGKHCEHCVEGFAGKGNACVPDGKKYLAMKAYQGSQYVIGTEKKNWNDARDACKKLNGDLVATETAAEYSHVFDENKKLGGGIHWYGASGQGANGGWKWVTGGAITSSPKGTGDWYSSYPSGSGKKCMATNSGHAKSNNWYSPNCSGTNRFICEY